MNERTREEVVARRWQRLSSFDHDEHSRRNRSPPRVLLGSRLAPATLHHPHTQTSSTRAERHPSPQVNLLLPSLAPRSHQRSQQVHLQLFSRVLGRIRFRVEPPRASPRRVRLRRRRAHLDACVLSRKPVGRLSCKPTNCPVSFLSKFLFHVVLRIPSQNPC